MEIVFHSHHATVSDRMRLRAVPPGTAPRAHAGPTVRVGPPMPRSALRAFARRQTTP